VQLDHVKLGPDDATPSAMFIGIGFVVWLSFVAVIGIARSVRCTGSSKAQNTELAANVLAYEAYPEYLVAHGEGARCPTPADLVDYTNGPEAVRDAWGNRFVLACTTSGESGKQILLVTSPGEDGRLGTADDIWAETAL
jgi:hypothetical protein